MAEIREADLPRDLDAVRRLWLEYLTWGNDGLESRYGFRLPVREAVEHDLAIIANFQPPDGRLLLAFEGDVAVGTACMRRTGPDTAEIKRMYVQPSHRRAGAGRALLDQLIAAAADRRIRARPARQPRLHDGRPRPVPLQRVRGDRALPRERDPRRVQAPLGVHGANAHRRFREHRVGPLQAGLRVAFDDARVSPAEIEFPRRLGNYSRPPK
jgi:GNAT superfamily N-acetyltransferase